MDTNRYTEKARVAFLKAHSTANEYGNVELKGEHLLYGLLFDAQGLVPQILEKAGGKVEELKTTVLKEIEKFPKGNAEISFSRTAYAMLEEAEKLALSMRDDFVSVEHLYLGILEKADGALRRALEAYGADKEKFLRELFKLRGGKRVTSDNPEDTYDALGKYGVDLVEKAREQKIDPIIGRDE